MIKVKSKCRDCNGEGVHCDYQCAARGRKCTHRCSNGCICKWDDEVECTVQEYEVEVQEQVSNDINRQIDNQWNHNNREGWEVETVYQSEEWGIKP